MLKSTFNNQKYEGILKDGEGGTGGIASNAGSALLPGNRSCVVAVGFRNSIAEFPFALPA